MFDNQKSKTQHESEQEDVEMQDKENESAHHNLTSMNSEELMKAVERAGLMVYKKDESEKRQVKITSGKEAYFALLA